MDTQESEFDRTTVDVIIHDAEELHASMKAFGLKDAAERMDSVLTQLKSDQVTAETARS